MVGFSYSNSQSKDKNSFNHNHLTGLRGLVIVDGSLVYLTVINCGLHCDCNLSMSACSCCCHLNEELSLKSFIVFVVYTLIIVDSVENVKSCLHIVICSLLQIFS